MLQLLRQNIAVSYLDIFSDGTCPYLGPMSLFDWKFDKEEEIDSFSDRTHPILGPLSLFNWQFVKEEMVIFSNRTRPYPGASESI